MLAQSQHARISESQVSRNAVCLGSRPLAAPLAGRRVRYSQTVVCAANRAVLTPVEGKKSKLARIELVKESFVVGSGTSADVRIDDAAVAPEHCKFEWRGTRLFVTDMGKGTSFDGSDIMTGVAYIGAFRRLTAKHTRSHTRFSRCLRACGLVMHPNVIEPSRLASAVGNNAVICLGGSESATFSVQFDSAPPAGAGSVDAMLAQAFQQARLRLRAEARSAASRTGRRRQPFAPSAAH